MKRLGRAAATALAVAALAIAGAMLAAPLVGLERYVIAGDSMSPAYERGSLLFSQRVAVSELTEGDVITYAPPAGAGPGGLVTHRIVAVRGAGPTPVLRTRGDANAGADPWRFRLAGEEQARALFAVPYVGFGLAALGIRPLRVLLLGAPALLVAAATGARLWRRATEDAAAHGPAAST